MNLSSAWNFRSIEYHHALYLNFGTLAGLWPWAIPSLKIVLGFFHHHHEIFVPQSIIMHYIKNLGLRPDWGVGHQKKLSRRADLRRILSAASVRRRAGRTPIFSRRRRRVKYGSALGRRRRAPIGFGLCWDAHTNGRMFKISTL
jgi:hypothetical protein